MISLLRSASCSAALVGIAISWAGLSNGLAQVEKLKGPPVAAPVLQRSFADWKAACDKLPSNRALKGRWPRKEMLPLQKFSEFEEVVTAFFAQCKTGALARSTNWVGSPPRSDQFFNTDTAYFVASPKSPNSPAIPFQPYAQKVLLSPGSEIFFHADFHGDVRSLLVDLTWLNENGYLNGFNITKPSFSMIFLGDYTDRGAYGIEVLYTLLRLKLANPDRVTLARGNHEEVSLQSRYGFLEECRRKYGSEFNPQKVERAYDFLPVVIYVGSENDFIQCNHGGMEPGFSPQPLLESTSRLAFRFIGPLHQQRFTTEHPDWLTGAASRKIASQYLRDFIPESPIDPTILGFMWNDFAVFADEPDLTLDPKRAFIYGSKSTRYLLQSASTQNRRVQAVFRGHQQSPTINPMMRRLLASKGVFRHWQEADSAAKVEAPISELARILEHDELRGIPPSSVWTFNVAPDSVYGQGCEFSFDSFGILAIGASFEQWRLKVVNVPVPQ
ncbi:MAG: hypothetical protein JWM16_4636 [Verrucomicrobiales bacterium]|nr:hypothetical protein [Verrucomicrobiales bacterium]